MSEYKLAVFGELPIATKVVEFIESREDLELVAVVVENKSPHNNDPWRDTPCLAEYCAQKNIQPISLDQFNSRFGPNELDLGLLCRFGKVIKEPTIRMFKYGIINMHGGLLPDFAGLYSCNMSVLFGASKGGGTLHFVDAGIDTGDVIRRCEFPITADDTGFTVFQKTQKALYENMIDIVPKVLRGEIVATPMEKIESEEEPRYFDKKSIHIYKEITQDKSPEEIDRIVRAFDFPGYEPAYFLLDGSKFYVKKTI